MITKLFILLLCKTCLSQDLDNLFQEINDEVIKMNAIAADIAWESSINTNNPVLIEKSNAYQKKWLTWQHQTCDKLGTLYSNHFLNDTQKRQTYLLCRGPKFTLEEARLTRDLYEELQAIYSDAEVCIPIDSNNNNIKTVSEIEDAILNYLSSVKEFLNFEQDFVHFAAKVALNGNVRKTNKLCLKGENDFEKLMEFSRNEEVLRWLWLTWREKIGPPMKDPYRRLVIVENKASRRNGYPNIGASWRDEQEMPRLRQMCQQLYDSVRPLYRLLHGVVRFYLRRYYGEMVPETGLIPAHLFGNLWSQNWEPLSEIMLPKYIDLNKRIKELNWTVEHMVRRAEDFYQSLGLPAMTDTFWRKSIFTREKHSCTRCHGTAADMFQDGDYRLLYCAEPTKEDFYVLHHELGHIQYYMAYAHQPALYRQANTALHEAIGDTIMYGVITPQHLNRLGLINDSMLYTTDIDTQNNENPSSANKLTENIFSKSENDITKDNEDYIKKYSGVDDNKTKKNFKYNILKNGHVDINSDKKSKIEYQTLDTKINKLDVEEHLKTYPELFDNEHLTIDMILLFKQALSKLPQIPFALLIDEYRWKYFEGNIVEENRDFWDLVERLQGIAPPKERGEEYFDIGAKFHVPDNTPYIRYFLSSFLQHQLFEKLCKAAIFGQRYADDPVPSSIGLSKCDIYGSKTAGKILKDLMSRGHSQHWTEILQATINESEISASALLRYYQPLHEVLEQFVNKHRIPIGW